MMTLETFTGDVVYKGDPLYDAAITRWAINAQRQAKLVLYPKNASDIALAFQYASANNLPVAVKGGGHSPSGASSIQDGLVIDISRYFHYARVDPAKQLVYVGGGSTWEVVDTEAIKHGLATPGGTVNHTGVGGLLLGGGYGFLSGRHGLVIDNLIQATLVTVDGSEVIANATSHQDLFWAIRGGGGNFGVVTEFVLKLHPQRRNVFAGILIFPPPLLDKVVEAADSWWTSGLHEDEAALFGYSRGPPPERQPCILAIIFYNGSEEAGRANFKRFYDLGPVMDTAKERPYEELNTLQNPMATYGRYRYMSGSSLRSSMSAHMHAASRKVFESSAAAPEAHGPPFDVLFAYELFPNTRIRQIDPGATAFRSRGPQPTVVIAVTWDDEGSEERSLKTAREISRALVQMVESTAERDPSESENKVYGNYVTDRSNMGYDRGRRLWGDNYVRLQQVKAQYDSREVLSQWFGIEPAR